MRVKLRWIKRLRIFLQKLVRDGFNKMYVKFTDKTFTVEDAAKELGITPSSANFHLMNFVERGMLTTEREPGGPHHLQFAVTPSEHPECFNKPSSVISRRSGYLCKRELP